MDMYFRKAVKEMVPPVPRTLSRSKSFMVTPCGDVEASAGTPPGARRNN